ALLRGVNVLRVPIRLPAVRRVARRRRGAEAVGASWHLTHRWREVDSNPRSPRKREFSGSGSRPGARCRLPALDDAHRGEPGAARRGTKPIGRQRRGAGDWRAPEPIAAMIEACRSGPIGAHVTKGRPAPSQDDGSLGSIQWLRFRAARNSASTVKAGLELEHNLFRNADPQPGLWIDVVLTDQCPDASSGFVLGLYHSVASVVFP